MRKIIKGDIDLNNLYLTELFDLSDVEVRGDFSCNFNDITNLKGSPHTVVGIFSCRHNNLTSLIGAPQTVGGHFFCNNNNLSSLVGAPSAVGGGFYCTGNNLDSLEGIPKEIVGAFLIEYELKYKFPEEYIRSLSKIKGSILYV